MWLDPVMHLAAEPPYVVLGSRGTQGGQQGLFFLSLSLLIIQQS